MRRFLAIVFAVIFVASLGAAMNRTHWDGDDVIVQVIFSGMSLVLAINFWRAPRLKERE